MVWVIGVSVWDAVWAVTDGQAVGWLKAGGEEPKVTVSWPNKREKRKWCRMSKMTDVTEAKRLSIDIWVSWKWNVCSFFIFWVGLEIFWASWTPMREFTTVRQGVLLQLLGGYVQRLWSIPYPHICVLEENNHTKRSVRLIFSIFIITITNKLLKTLDWLHKTHLPTTWVSCNMLWYKFL